MVCIPFIYFLLLLIYILKKNGIGVGAYVTSLYVVTSLFAIFLIKIDPNYIKADSLTFISTMEYCVLITLFILPLVHFKPDFIYKIKFKNSRFIKYLTLFFFYLTIVLFIAYFNDFTSRFIASQVAETRSLVNNGELSLTPYPKMVSLVLSWLMAFGSMSYIMIFIFFFSICYMKRNRTIKFMSIIGSLGAVVIGVIGMDRSRMFFWIIIFGLCLVLFWSQMNKKIRKITFVCSIILGAVMISYMTFVTINRFAQTQSGSQNSVIVYAGQPYLNFCKFAENYPSPEGITLKYIMPVTHTFIFADYKGSVDYQAKMTRKTGMECGVFYTSIGDFIVSDGAVGPFILTLFYLILCHFFFKRKVDMITFEKYFVSFIVMTIPSVGIITYMYNNWTTALTTYIVLFFLFTLKDKKTMIFVPKIGK